MASLMFWVSLMFAFGFAFHQADSERNNFTEEIEEVGAKCESGECPKKGAAMLQKHVGAMHATGDLSTRGCQKWCAKNAKDWASKCKSMAASCGSCSDCSTPKTSAAPAPAPAPPPEEKKLSFYPPLPFDINEEEFDDPEDSSEDCQSWCAKNTFGWAAKCNSLTACGGCAACADVKPTAEPTPVPPVGACKPFCKNNPSPWATKCRTMAAGCGACPDCPAPPTPAPTPPWEETCTSVMNPGGEVPKGKPNILWIGVDDMQWSGGGPGAKRPNFDWLAEQGVWFKRAVTDHPICCPSRTSFLNGIRGGVSGYFMPRAGKPGKTGLAVGPKFMWDNTILNSSMQLMEFFRKKCYYVVGTGKINHYERYDHWPGCRDCLWDEWYAHSDFGPKPFNGKKFTPHPRMPQALKDEFDSSVDFDFSKISQVPYADDNDDGTGWKYTGTKKDGGPRDIFHYYSPTDRDLLPDEYNANWAIEKLGEFTMKQSGQPWMLMLGLVRPHDPVNCPDEYYEDFENLDDIELEVGWDVVDPKANLYANISMTDKLLGFQMYDTLPKAYGDVKTGLQTYVQAYYACVKFVDSQAGRVLKALRTSPFWDNTIVVVLSDNGWQNGPKQYVFKNTPWETGVKVPLIMRAPGVSKAGSTSNVPVTLTNIYPTLMDLAGYAGEETRKNSSGHALTGVSMKPLLINPEMDFDDWGGPPGISQIYPTANAVQLPYGEDGLDDCNSVQECNHWSMGYKQWRYMIYSNGAQELYNIEEDEHELTNLIDKDETYVALAAELKTILAENTGMDVAKMGSFQYPWSEKYSGTTAGHSKR